MKFRSSQTRAGRFIAESAIANEDHHEDIKLIKLTFSLRSYLFSFLFFRYIVGIICLSDQFSLGVVWQNLN